MTIKNFISKPTTPSMYELAISQKLNNEKSKKPKDVPLFILMEKNNKRK